MAKVVDIDHGWDALVKASKDAKDAYISVGVHSSAGVYVHGGKVATAAQVAAFNEFGTKRRGSGATRVVRVLLNRGPQHVPARPFMRRAFNRNKTKYLRIMGRLGQRILDGEIKLKRGLDLLGLTAKADIQRSIETSKGWAKANAPSTIKAKTRAGRAGNQPLKDTGSLINSRVTWEAHLTGLRSKLSAGRGA
jgi:HK97 gp10 family phage protein